jgi:effector-binding domain-containing protein
MNHARPFRLARAVLIPAVTLSLCVSGALAQSPPPTSAPAPSDTTPSTPAPAAPAPATPAPAEPAPASPPAATTPAPPPAKGVDTAPEAFGQEITLTPKTVLIYTGKATWDSAFDTLIDAFKRLNAFLDKQGVKPSGNPLIVYTSTDDNGFVFQAEIPVDQDLKGLGKDMSMGKSPDGKALKFVHHGSYDNMDNTYEAITNYLDDKKQEAKDLFIEEYVTDPLKTEEDKLVINVYVPLK